MAEHLFAFLEFGSLLLMAAAPSMAQQTATPRAAVMKSASPTPTQTSDSTPANVLTPAQWRRVDTATSRALTWLATQQQPDGSFPTLASGQPAITGLCIMAFIAHGHVPGKGQYGP